jgi:hypothetical protein
MSCGVRMMYWMTWALLANGLLPAATQAPPVGDGPGSAHVEGFALLFRSEVREELGIAEEQEQQLRQLGDALRSQWQTMWRDVQQLPPQQRWQAMRQRIVQQREQMDHQVRGILQDHQLTRLKQVQLQVEMQQRGMTEVLSSPEVRQALGLTDEQNVEFRQVVHQAEQEMQQQIRTAVQQARERIVSVLDPQQRTKWQELVGAPFEPGAVERDEMTRVFGSAMPEPSDPALRRPRNRK